VNFRLLGDLEVVIDGERVQVAGHKQRALLAVLLLHANEVVGPDRLIEDLWGEEPPAQAAKSVQVHVWRLRKALAAVSGASGEGRLLTRSSGYVFRVEPGELDVGELERLVREGSEALREGRFERAAGLLREGLALWRGPPLPEFAYDSFAQREIGRLGELRLQALQGRIDADLALGRHALLVGELEALVSEHPLAERLRAQLMLALYRSGRQADALEVYRQTRRVLLDDLGLEPGEDLKRLHRAVLDHDPELELAPVVPGPVGAAVEAPAVDGGPGFGRAPHASGRALRRSRSVVLIAASASLGLIVVAVAAVLISNAHPGGGVTALANSVAVIDPRANRVIAQTSVGVAPGSITAGAGGVWVANTEDHSISNIDPGSRRVVRNLGFGDTVDSVAAEASALWTVDSTRGVASRIDPTFKSAVSRVAVGDRAGVGSSPNPVAVGGGAAWVANDASAVIRIADGGASVLRIDVGNHPSGIAIGEGATWVADDWDGTVSRVDSTGGVSAVIPVGPGASGIAVGAGSVWVADTLADTLVRIDPTTETVTTTIRVGSRPRGVAFGAGSVWVANSGDGSVSRVDPQTNRVAAKIVVGQSPQALVATAGVVWVSVAASPAAPASPSGSPPGVLRVVREGPFSSTDPALSYNTFDPQALQMVYATCAGLLTYPDRPAPEGTRLVPDVARALPGVSADGRTYTFIVRPGFRFSPPSGAPVTAATFKHTIERALGPKLQGGAPSFIGDIVGMAAFQAGRTPHLAGVTASGDRLQVRLTAPAPDLPARIATVPFCAVPDDTPAAAQSQPIPSAGPYYVVSGSRDQLVLARNPNYGGHRPRGPKEIVYSFGVGLPRALRQVTAGQSDYINAALFVAGGQSHAAVGLLQALEQRYGAASAEARTGHQRYFVSPWRDLEYFVFNTARPVFASARLRRAVNYAIDRRALVQHADLFHGGRATDHYLVPGIPGAHPVDVYPLGGPNLAKARQLAGGVHTHAAFYIPNGEPQSLEVARIVQTDLAAIGVTVDITALPGAELYTRLAKPGEPWDLAWTNWGADFADPFTMINELFDPAVPVIPNFGRFNDPALTRRMRYAATLTGDRRLHAYARLDEQLTRNDPPAAAWGIGTFREFFSARVGCQIYQPIYGTDLGTVCLRT
jgi:YVTN family beta-propeller protein